MAAVDRLAARAAVGVAVDESAAAEAQRAKEDREIRQAIEKVESTKPQVFVRLHGPGVASERIVQLPPWYPGQWLLPRLRHPIRTLLGVFDWPRKGWLLVRALVGGSVRTDVYQSRMGACQKCPVRQVWITGGRAKEYCGACGCARWWLSRLQNKNHLRKWACPLRRWDENAGPYPDADLRARLVESGYATVDDLRPSGSCRSCGGGNGQAVKDPRAMAELGAS